MSVSIETVEFERPSAQGAQLSELEGEPPYTIHGVALGAGDVTVGKSGIKKKWPADELRRAAGTLEGKKVVEDHSKKSRDVVGEVTKAGYKDEIGVIYEAELFDEDLAQKIKDGLLEVSIRGGHIDVDEMELDEETGAKIVEQITFADLSIVQTGAAPSNSVDIGEHEELSVAELSAFTETLEEDEEIEAGSYVQWDDKKGVVLTMPEDGEVEVDVYKESDGEFRPTGETTMVAVNDLSNWDVDEEDIGPMEDEADEEDESDEEEASEHRSADVPMVHRFESQKDALSKAQEMDLSGTHSMELDDERVWVPGADHGDYLKKMYEADEEEASGERVEGEEEEITSDADKEQNKDRSPERYPEGGDTEEASVDEGDESGEGNTESDTVAELQNYSFHTPEWSGTTEGEWSSPDMEDFDTDDLSEIDDHFLISADGFPPENFSDLKLPVVEPNGDLNVNALSAVKGGRGVSAVSNLSSDMEDRITDWVNKTAKNEFDRDWNDEEEAAHPTTDEQSETTDDTGDEPKDGQDGGSTSQTPIPVNVLTGDDLRQRRKSEESEMDSLYNKVDINMTENEIEEQLADLDEPVAVEKSDLEDLEDKADRFDEMSESLDDLKERTEILDEVDSDKVDELSEADDPVVVESARYESLTAEAEQVKNVYASSLSDEVEVFDAEELTDKFSIEELREKFEEHIGDPEEELGEPEPRSGDPEEEELEEQAESNDTEEASDEEEQAEEMRAELRDKILGGD